MNIDDYLAGMAEEYSKEGGVREVGRSEVEEYYGMLAESEDRGEEYYGMLAEIEDRGGEVREEEVEDYGELLEELGELLEEEEEEYYGDEGDEGANTLLGGLGLGKVEEIDKEEEARVKKELAEILEGASGLGEAYEEEDEDSSLIVEDVEEFIERPTTEKEYEVDSSVEERTVVIKLKNEAGYQKELMQLGQQVMLLCRKDKEEGYGTAVYMSLPSLQGKEMRLGYCADSLGHMLVYRYTRGYEELGIEVYRNLGLAGEEKLEEDCLKKKPFKF